MDNIEDSKCNIIIQTNKEDMEKFDELLKIEAEKADKYYTKLWEDMIWKYTYTKINNKGGYTLPLDPKFIQPHNPPSLPNEW